MEYGEKCDYIEKNGNQDVSLVYYSQIGHFCIY